MTSFIAAEDVWYRYSHSTPYVLRGASIQVSKGDSFGIVGESGSGKTTLGRLLLGTLRPTRGRIVVPPPKAGALISVAAVYQDVRGSFDPLYTVNRSLAEAMGKASGVGQRVASILTDVGLEAALGARRPGEVSGGQLQRASIARAIASRAEALVLDEPTSSLDAHIRGRTLALLSRLRSEFGLTYIVISHDFNAVAQLCTHVAVMAAGQVVETGAAKVLLAEPQHPHTAALVRASLVGRRAIAELREESGHSDGGLETHA